MALSSGRLSWLFNADKKECGGLEKHAMEDPDVRTDTQVDGPLWPQPPKSDGGRAQQVATVGLWGDDVRAESVD